MAKQKREEDTASSCAAASADDLQLLLLLAEVMNNERKRSCDLQMVRSSGGEGFLHSRRSSQHFLGDGATNFAWKLLCRLAFPKAFVTFLSDRTDFPSDIVCFLFSNKS